ncbi:flagellar assembly protein FliH [Pseudomonas sp. Choline-3u-10]|jgi:flagellar assembly protein FliH|uniref:flagellar assembly protein FliH n=1 Tax=Pseudomonadaceae TaxID=135621 RepID=UPI000617BC2C|nr:MULTISPECIES: flagellar assembly protein FliH [Pseudomonadaceae]MAL35856.1 flagellar assembly protein FliH [Pseudomonas sp.]MBU0951102.1 flagellar assembly protein FliH [Gammaproteobacteria bacterium]KJJ63908.1 flagellar assembly protein FliH [Pseudomonas sp. 10B238]MBK3794962.1 flagellar assembly protein FliH [Stutzerimonas stutzeri]MBK3878685.1 flagellar assembly protein FliH [Stutzerimonas stutzeri]|tara:strand:+ start:5167 stop:5955 length:789 start_codon:yes stop_codon:yes gene_type:complete
MSKENPSDVIRAKDVNVFDRWALPSFDPLGAAPEDPEIGEEPVEDEDLSRSEDVPIAEVKPLTLDELEAIRQEAYNEGFSTGEKDGFHAGQLKARQEAEAALNPKLESLEKLMTQLLEPIADQDRNLEHAMVTLVSQLAREVIQRDLLIDSSQIRQVLREALKLLPMGASNVRIYINPQDFDLVKALRERHEETWRIVEDSDLLPGGCRIETEQSRIDASVETRLGQAISQLFEQQRENATSPPEADLHLDLGSGAGPADAP